MEADDPRVVQQTSANFFDMSHCQLSMTPSPTTFMKIGVPQIFSTIQFAAFMVPLCQAFHPCGTKTADKKSFRAFLLILHSPPTCFSCLHFKGLELHWILLAKSKILETSNKFEIYSHTQHKRVFSMK